MSRITANDSMVQMLEHLVEPVEVCNASGKVLGRFIPEVQGVDLDLYEEAKRVFDFDEAKRRSGSDQPRLTMEEVQKRLRKLEQEK